MSKEKEHKKLVPTVRFKEFRGEWEETTLDKISPSIFDGTHQTPKYTNDGIPFFSVENIVSGNKNKFISREAYLYATKKNKPEFGDVLITRIGSIGVPKVVDWEYEFSIYVTLAVVKKSEQFDSYFLESYVQSSRFQKEIRRRSLLKAAPQKINMNELRNCEVLLPPSLPEQQKIAATLTSLDQLIAAETEKRDALQAHKKGLLQQLFPAQGEKVPKLRFGAFRGEWEETTLGDVCDMQAGKFVRASEIKEIRSEGLFPCYGGNGLRGYTNSFTHTGKYSLIGRQGALCGNVNFVDGKFHATEHAVVVTPEDNANTVWLYFVLDLLNLNQYAIGQAQPGLSVKNLKKVILHIPEDLKEQKKIANCLSSLDDLIAAQSEKIEALQAHKKGLMQQLFPNPNAR